jgi:uncharacterized membrane protein
MSVRISASISVGCDISFVYKLWKDVEKFPLFMKDIVSIRAIDPVKSHWKMRLAPGIEMQWDAVIIEDKPDEVIRWKSTGDKIGSSGEVLLRKENERETFVQVNMSYFFPLESIGNMFLKAMKNPADELESDLHRFKKYSEALYKNRN